MDYSINVAVRVGAGWDKKGEYSHFCRVDAGTHPKHALRVYTALEIAFPAPHYVLEMTRLQTTGTPVDVEHERREWEK